MKEWDNDKHEEALERRRQKNFDSYKYAVKYGKTDDNGKVIGGGNNDTDNRTGHK